MRNQIRRRPSPKVITVSTARYLTPSMIRVTFSGPEIADIQDGCEGAYCKLFLPKAAQTKSNFADQLENGPRPNVRTYTVRHIRPSAAEMDIDFVEHGDNGPASAWAISAKPGSFCGFSGPNPIKMDDFNADRYLLAADMSALPVVAATLEKMPRNAVGDAFFEIACEDDKQDVDAPIGVNINWLISNTPACPGPLIVEAVRNLKWLEGRVQTCIAGESTMVKMLREYICLEQGLPRNDTYISGYWKFGLIEDEHKKVKRDEANAT